MSSEGYYSGVCLCVCVVWHSLTPPSKIGKGSGEPCIIDLCHKKISGCSSYIGSNCGTFFNDGSSSGSDCSSYIGSSYDTFSKIVGAVVVTVAVT